MMTKIIAVLFAVVAMRRIIARYRRGGRVTLDLLFWVCVFAGIAVAAFKPYWTDVLAEWMGLSGGFHALTFLGIASLFLITLRLVGKVRELDRNITQLVRARAIEGAWTAEGEKKAG